MHYLGLVFLDEPTTEALEKAMKPHEEKHWDWYRPGGRWDGWLQGKEEMDRRATSGGYNYNPENELIAGNFCKVSELPTGKQPAFFVADDEFVPREYWNDYEKSPWDGGGYGAIVPTPHWEERRKGINVLPVQLVTFPTKKT